MFSNSIYMKKLFFILLGCVVFGCSGTKNKPKLLTIVACAEDSKIYDRDVKYEGNKLFHLNNLSYSTTYTRVHIRIDSTQKNEIRYKLAETSERVFKKVFPKGKSVDATNLLNKNFNEIADALLYFRKETWDNAGGIEKLTVATPKSSLQLFIDFRCYKNKEGFSNHLVLYVFDIKNKDVMYYDYIHYKCDPRDETMFMKTLYYGMNKLKNSVK